MRINLTEKEIKLKKLKDGYSYQLKDIKVSGIPTKAKAIEHAENLSKKFLRKMFV